MQTSSASGLSFFKWSSPRPSDQTSQAPDRPQSLYACLQIYRTPELSVSYFSIVIPKTRQTGRQGLEELIRGG